MPQLHAVSERWMGDGGEMGDVRVDVAEGAELEEEGAKDAEPGFGASIWGVMDSAFVVGFDLRWRGGAFF